MKSKLSLCLILMGSLFLAACGNVMTQDNAAAKAAAENSIFTGTSIVREADRAMAAGDESESENLYSGLPDADGTEESDAATSGSEATSTPTPTATPKAEVTPKPTATPKPEATPKPTATPKPEATPTPAPAATPTPTPKATSAPTQEVPSAPVATPTPTPAAPAHEHNWVYDMYQSCPAWCEEDGWELYVCDGCGEQKTVTLPMLGHTTDRYVDKEDNGTTAYRCNRCWKVMETITTPAGCEHQWVQYNVYEGELSWHIVYNCTLCGELKTEYQDK